jgi:iron complex transport system substrate-binding protein
MFPPSRIVCLTEETVETLYLLSEQDRIVGISGYVVRPAQARREKPRVSAFTSANIDKILALKPDLVLTFSDLQADIVADLIRRGLDVHAFNQRSIAGILDMIRTLGAMVDAKRTGSTARRNTRNAVGPSSNPRGMLTKAAEGILRGVGRSADLRNWMGFGARRDCRRHRPLR